MNENALSSKSTIEIKETYAGKLPRSTGFKRSDGYIMPIEERLRLLRASGRKVKKTKHGIVIT